MSGTADRLEAVRQIRPIKRGARGREPRRATLDRAAVPDRASLPANGVSAASVPGLAVPPGGVALGELVEFDRDLDLGTRRSRLTDAGLTLETIDVPALLRAIAAQSLIGVAHPTPDREVAEVDGSRSRRLVIGSSSQRAVAVAGTPSSSSSRARNAFGDMSPTCERATARS